MKTKVKVCKRMPSKFREAFGMPNPFTPDVLHYVTDDHTFCAEVSRGVSPNGAEFFCCVVARADVVPVYEGSHVRDTVVVNIVRHLSECFNTPEEALRYAKQQLRG